MRCVGFRLALCARDKIATEKMGLGHVPEAFLSAGIVRLRGVVPDEAADEAANEAAGEAADEAASERV